MRSFVKTGMPFLAAISLTLIAGKADATTYQLAISGAASGSDYSDIFGLGDTVSDVSYESIFTINDAAPGSFSLDEPGIQTGLSSGYSAPVVTAAFTINGETVNFGSSSSDTTAVYKKILTGSADYFAGAVDSSSMVDFVYIGANIISSDPAFASNFDYHTPFALLNLSGSGSSGGLNFGYYDGFLSDGSYYQGPSASLNFSIATAQLTEASAAVPELATWAMMIGGFGLVGGVARRMQNVRLFSA